MTLKRLRLIVFIIVPFIFSNCEEEIMSAEVSTEEEETVQDKESTINKFPTFNLFHPTKGVNALVANDDFFSADGNTHKFHLPEGTVNAMVSRKHARIECSQVSDRFGIGKMTSFAANYNVSTTVPGQVTVTQLFAVGIGPQIRIEVRNDGSLRAGWGYGNQDFLATEGQWDRSNFNLKITTNGETASIYLNGELKVENRALKHRSDTNQFRWGLYYNEVMPKSVRSTMSDIAFSL